MACHPDWEGLASAVSAQLSSLDEGWPPLGNLFSHFFVSNLLLSGWLLNNTECGMLSLFMFRPFLLNQKSHWNRDSNLPNFYKKAMIPS